MVQREEVKYNVVEELGTISTGTKGWSTKVKRIEWNGGEPKIDIRSWNEDDTRMGKGITLTDGEVDNLIEILKVYQESR